MHIPELSTKIIELGEILRQNKYMLGTAESCTGGLISMLLTDVSGSSSWFKGTIVSYANEVKENMLHVPHETLLKHGAVSEQTALAMVRGVQDVLQLETAISVTGIAGPSGGTKEKPVGTVWIGFAIGSQHFAQHHVFSGDRADVRYQTAMAAITTLLHELRR
ncbi:CinA family protein [Halodesulfovibrio marinisediminis]|uniref:Nicotinamide-nucleotide amidase n=1 Tax=Halodesulfovibrio marinisediminis DSM 17456 TaxID=1121457 RepID=A0A1N6ID19_9BACT|nr:CinA family protein [Halodesulfovibrio marinisediminis]SIO29920.1 nicotinamide-nucleotide amidase [Halodesulfovibrio marinisediminis DSM 17456]